MILEHIDGRKLTVDGKVVYLRKGVDGAQYLPLLQAEVDLETENEKGYDMVKELKPALPKTEVEKLKGPVDMAPSTNIPVLKPIFSTTSDSPEHTFTQVPKSDGRSQKDRDIMRQWAMGNVLQSRALALANDAMALSTEQTIARAKKIADELLKWVVER